MPTCLEVLYEHAVSIPKTSIGWATEQNTPKGKVFRVSIESSQEPSNTIEVLVSQEGDRINCLAAIVPMSTLANPESVALKALEMNSYGTNTVMWVMIRSENTIYLGIRYIFDCTRLSDDATIASYNRAITAIQRFVDDFDENLALLGESPSK